MAPGRARLPAPHAAPPFDGAESQACEQPQSAGTEPRPSGSDWNVPRPASAPAATPALPATPPRGQPVHNSTSAAGPSGHPAAAGSPVPQPPALAGPRSAPPPKAHRELPSTAPGFASTRTQAPGI